MKKTLFFVFASSVLFISQISAQCNTLPQTCATACDLGTLPASAQCGATDDSIHMGAVVSFALSNIGALAGNPSSIVTGCAYPAADVWYKFTATGNELSILLNSDTAHPLQNPNINLYSGNSCSSLLPVTCFTGSNGTLSQTYSPIQVGGTYYMQISGGSLTDQGNFILQLSNNTDCSKCVLGEFITASPPPLNGTYLAGQTVNFCFTVSNWNQNASNWLHGVIPSFGRGWDVSTFTPTFISLSCDTTKGAHWVFDTQDVSTNTGDTLKPGFFYETSLGSPNDTIDNNPGDNYGDPGVNGGSCQVTFCWNITARSGGGANSQSLSVTVMTTGDAQSGSWTSPGCENDPSTTFNAVISSCLPPLISTINPSCRKQNGAAIAVGQGAGPWTYVWANASGNTIDSLTNINKADTLLNLAPGQYFVTVTDANNCSNAEVATIQGLTDNFTLSVDSISCFNVKSPDGSISITPLQVQNEPYTYSLNGMPFQSNNSFTQLSAGTYKVITKNNLGCLDTLTAVVGLPTPISVSVLTNTPTTCSTQGLLSVQATGGTGALVYNWSNGHTGSSQNSLAAGVYHLTVTDQRSCTDTASYTVTAGANALTFAKPVIKNDSCFNSKNGSITANATGGTGAISYHWNTNSNTATISGLGANVYSVTATDSLGCTAATSYPVGTPAAVSIGPPSISPALCAVGGSISLTATGGTGVLTYSWSPLHFGDSITNLGVGTYKLTVTDQNHCSATANYNVPASANTFTFGNPVRNNISCYGKQDGSITVTTVGGASPVRYQWNTSAKDTTASITGLPTGESYTVTATDANGCTATATYAIVGPAAILLGSANITSATCDMGGSISVSGYGGSGLLTFTWSNTTQTGDSISNLTGGTYFLTVTDQNSCSITAAYNVGAVNGGVSLNTPVVVNEKCFGSQNGSVGIMASGGHGHIRYAWSNNDTTPAINNLFTGVYSVTASDSLGCSASATFSITQPAAISLGDSSIAGSSCNNTGYIRITANGGTGALTYFWSNNETGDSIGALAASDYFLTITDQNGCTLSTTYHVPVLQGGISFADPDFTSVSCNGGHDGSITASASGGSGNLHYNWGGGNTSGTISGLSAGPHSVTVTDANNCSASITYIVSQPAVLNPNLSYHNFICYGLSNDTVTVQPTGGNPGYTYSWSNGQGTPSVILGGGIFTVTITDTKSCSMVVTDSVRQDPQISNTNILTLHLCDNPAHGDLKLDGKGGTGQLTYTVKGIGTNTSGYFPDLTSGSYNFTITDTAGCKQYPTAGPVVIPQSVASDSFTVQADSASCYGFNNGHIIITPQNQDGGPFVYQLDGGSFVFADTFTNVAAGEHNIVVKSFVYGCPRSYTATIGQPGQHTISINPDTVIANPGEHDTVSVTSDYPNPVYTWSPVTGINCTNCNPAVITADSVNSVYTVKVYSSPDSSCYSTDSVIIIVSPTALPDSFIMPSAFTPNGDGRNDNFGPVSSAKYTTATIKTFRIYNRWGQLVHNANAYWDGKFDGKDQPVGTYVYYIEVEYANRDNTGNSTFKKEGSVTLLR